MMGKFMKNISFRLCFVLMIVVLLSACVNYVVVNISVRRVTNDTLQKVNDIDSLYLKCLNDSLNEQEVTNIKTNVEQIERSVTKMDELKKYLFDGNTITFLSSFVLIFLAGILFDIEKRAKDRLNKTKDGISRLNIELMQLDVYKYATTSLVLSKNLQLELLSNKYVINERVGLLMYELNEQIKLLLAKLRDKELTCIIQRSKDVNRKCLLDIKLLIEKEEIWKNEENADKLNPLKECANHINECIKELDNLEIIT